MLSTAILITIIIEAGLDVRRPPPLQERMYPRSTQNCLNELASANGKRQMRASIMSKYACRKSKLVIQYRNFKIEWHTHMLIRL